MPNPLISFRLEPELLDALDRAGQPFEFTDGKYYPLD